jgi:hypothetical protein
LEATTLQKEIKKKKHIIHNPVKKKKKALVSERVKTISNENETCLQRLSTRDHLRDGGKWGKY